MTFGASTQSQVAFGLLNATAYTRSYSVSKKTSMFDTTPIGTKNKAYVPGEVTGQCSIEMMLDTAATANAQFDVLTDGIQTDYPITLGPFGFTTGSFVALIDGVNTDVTQAANRTDVLTASTAAEATNGVDFGTVVEDFTAITTDTTGTARDGGAGTANGGVAHLHVSAFSGLTSDVITIEHSVNGSTSWATLVTFSTVTGVSSQRVEVAPGTTVRQYLRVVDDVTGTGSITRLVAFARR